mgnify:CR=1 FL=1
MNTILMSYADHFNVNYCINPWMENHIGQAQTQLAQQQWQQLYTTLAQFADIQLVPSAAHCPQLQER